MRQLPLEFPQTGVRLPDRLRGRGIDDGSPDPGGSSTFPALVRRVVLLEHAAPSPHRLQLLGIGGADGRVLEAVEDVPGLGQLVLGEQNPTGTK